MIRVGSIEVIVERRHGTSHDAKSKITYSTLEGVGCSVEGMHLPRL